METAHRPADELAVFKDLRPDIGFGLGVVDIKATEVETADQVARAIERAEKTLGADRITYIHPDCGFWMLKRNIADGKIRALVKGRDLHEGRSLIAGADVRPKADGFRDFSRLDLWRWRLSTRRSFWAACPPRGDLP